MGVQEVVNGSFHYSFYSVQTCMKMTKHLLARVSLGAMVLMAPLATLAADNPFNRSVNQVTNVQSAAGLGTTVRSPAEIFGSIINVVLGFLGILLLGYMLYAGFLWMTSGGESEKAEEAMTMIKNSVIGLLIIIAAFSISNFVLNSLINISNGTT